MQQSLIRWYKKNRQVKTTWPTPLRQLSCTSTTWGKWPIKPDIVMEAGNTLFRSLFLGRDDVFPRRWENSKTGKAGYAPVCRNEWIRGICQKPRIKCSNCPNQAFVPVNDESQENLGSNETAWWAREECGNSMIIGT